MRHMIAALALACLWASPASAQDRPAFTVTNVALVSLAAVDLAQSIPCVQSGACREANPLYRHASASVFVAIKAASVGTITAAAWKLRTRRPKTAWAILIAATVAQGAVVVHNTRTLRKVR